MKILYRFKFLFAFGILYVTLLLRKTFSKKKKGEKFPRPPNQGLDCWKRLGRITKTKTIKEQGKRLSHRRSLYLVIGFPPIISVFCFPDCQRPPSGLSLEDFPKQYKIDMEIFSELRIGYCNDENVTSNSDMLP